MHSWLLRLVCLAVLLNPVIALAGAGISLLTIFEPRAASQETDSTACGIADSLHEEVRRLMAEHEVWGIELLNRDASTSVSLQYFGQRAPEWKGEYTPEWVSALNTNEMITYAVLGRVTKTGDGQLSVTVQLRDFILNHEIAEVSTVVQDTAAAGKELAPRILKSLQLYFAEVIEVGEGKALVNVGLETLSTGSLLTAFAHGHLGAHRPGYPAHGHREEDDHLIGSTIYHRYRGTVATTSTIHSHTRSHWRSLLREFGPAYDNASTGGVTSSNALQTSASAEELRLLNLAHFHSGKPTGTLRITGFIKPHAYYNAYYALATVESGFVVPGAFVRKNSPDKSP